MQNAVYPVFQIKHCEGSNSVTISILRKVLGLFLGFFLNNVL